MSEELPITSIGWHFGQWVKRSDNREFKRFESIDPPPNEPHPSQLKRCEICEHHEIVRVGLEDKYLCQIHDDWCPPTRTCDNWNWDKHDTKGAQEDV